MTPEDLRTLPADGIGRLPPLLRSLWQDAHGHWDAAHQTAGDVATPNGAWVHAYLHRREGDPGNAAYWYRQAGMPPSTGPFEAEWNALASALLTEESKS